MKWGKCSTSRVDPHGQMGLEHGAWRLSWWWKVEREVSKIRYRYLSMAADDLFGLRGPEVNGVEMSIPVVGTSHLMEYVESFIFVPSCAPAKIKFIHTYIGVHIIIPCPNIRPLRPPMASPTKYTRAPAYDDLYLLPCTLLPSYLLQPRKAARPQGLRQESSWYDYGPQCPHSLSALARFEKCNTSTHIPRPCGTAVDLR